MKTKTLTTILFGAGVTSIILYSLTANEWKYILQCFSIFLLISGASLVFGGLGGFLFGIPKVNKSPKNDNDEITTNTNLEEVSDWLTKLLLGATLSQVDKILNWINHISHSIANHIAAMGDETSFINSIIAYFTICGFLIGYLTTRLKLPKLFANVENDNSTSDDSQEDNPTHDVTPRDNSNENIPLVDHTTIDSTTKSNPINDSQNNEGTKS